MPSSWRARSSIASLPCLRSRTSAASAPLRTSSWRFLACWLSTCRSPSQARSHPPLPNQSGYCISTIRSTSTAPRIFKRSSHRAERLAAGVAHRVAEVLLDAQQLVVLRHAVGARQRAGLDLQRVRADRDVGDGGVLGL